MARLHPGSICANEVRRGGRRARRAAFLSVALMASLWVLSAVGLASAASTPVVTCVSDPNIFNTAYNSATGGILANNAQDANWKASPVYYNPAGTSTVSLPSNPTWSPAVVGNQAVGAWAASPYSNANWIQNRTPADANNYGDWYYMYQFTLDPSVDPSTFGLQMNFLADNTVAEVFVNGVAQSTKTTGLPQLARPWNTSSGNTGSTNPYYYVGFTSAHSAATTLNHDWQSGVNTIIVQIKSGQPQEGFDAQVRPSALCPVDLAIAKTATPNPYEPGQPLTYKVTVTNRGPGNAGGLSVTDPLPAALSAAGFTWTCSATSGSSCKASGSGNINDIPVGSYPGPSIYPGGSLTYTVTGTVPGNTSGALNNTATVAASPGTVDPGCNPSCASTSTDPPAAPTVSLTKTGIVSPAADQAGARLGDVISYGYTVKNTGNINLRSVAVNDPTIGSVSCPVPSAPGLTPGASLTCTANGSHLVTQADVDTGQVTDTATAAGTDTSGVVSPQSGPSTVTIPAAAAQPTVSIRKIAHASGGDTTPIFVGETIGYSYLVANTGNISLASVSVDDPTVGSVSCPTPAAPGLAPGDSLTCTAAGTHTVTQTDVDTGDVSDTATASCRDAQGNPCPASPPSSVNVPSLPDPRVSIVKRGAVSPLADQDAVKAGDTIAYSYRVTNVGNVTLQTVSVSDPTLGAVSCPAPASPGLAPGGAVTCTADSLYTVTQADVDAGHVNDTAVASCADTQANTCPRSDPSTVTILATPPRPGVSILKSAAVTPAADQNAAKLGASIAYSYKLTNTGNVTLKTLSVVDPTIGAVTCPAPSAPGLQPAQSVTCTADASHAVVQADVDAGSIKDTATAGCTDTRNDPCAVSTPSTATVSAAPANASVTIEKRGQVSPAGDQNALQVGDTISYAYKVTNTGNVSLKTISVTDPTGGSVTCPSPAEPGLAPGDSLTCTGDSPHLVTQADIDAGHVNDMATAGCKDVQGNACPTSSPSTVSLSASPAVDSVSIKKIANAANGDQNPITLGEKIQYSYLVTNTGNVTLASVSVEDPTAGSVTCPTPAVPGLAPGRSETCTANAPYTVTQTDVDSGHVTDIARARCTDTKGNTCLPSQPSSVTVRSDPAPAVAIGKSASVQPSADQTAVKLGDLISYSYTVTNVGNVTLASVSVNDPSAGSVTCPAPAAPGLAPGGSLTCTADLPHGVSQADVDAGVVADTATAGCIDTLGTHCTTSAPSTANVYSGRAPQVAIEKSGAVSPAADQTGVRAGDTISYSYVVTNIGNVTLGSVTVNDPTIGAVSCPAPSAPGLSPGEHLTCTADVPHTVTQGELDAGSVSDTAGASCTDVAGEPCPASNQSTVTIPAEPHAPSVSVQKHSVVSPAADQTNVKVGDQIAYSYAVKNTGNVTLPSVSASDPTAGSVTCPKPSAPGLAPGASLTCTADSPYTVTQADIDRGGAKDIAVARCTGVGGTLCPDSDPSPLTDPASATPRVALQKTATITPAADQNGAKPGDHVSYTFTVTNVGNVDLKSVDVTDPSAGAVTCPLPPPPGLAPGASLTCTSDLQHEVRQADVTAGKIVNTATATGTDTTGRSSPTSDPASATLNVTAPVSELAISKHVNHSAASPGQNVTYTIVVANHGPDAAANVTVTDTPSIALKILSTHTTPGSCQTAGKSVTCKLGTLANGARATITLTATLLAAGTERNTARVTSDSTNPKPRDSVAAVTTKVTASLHLRKVASRRTAHAGQNVRYRIVVSNPMAIAAHGVTVCDSLPRALVFVSASSHSHRSAGRYCWTIMTLNAHRSQAFAIVANVAPGRGGNVTNTATAIAHGTSQTRSHATVRVLPARRIGCGSASDVRAASASSRPLAHIAC